MHQDHSQLYFPPSSSYKTENSRSEFNVFPPFPPPIIFPPGFQYIYHWVSFIQFQNLKHSYLFIPFPLITSRYSTDLIYFFIVVFLALVSFHFHLLCHYYRSSLCLNPYYNCAYSRNFFLTLVSLSNLPYTLLIECFS